MWNETDRSASEQYFPGDDSSLSHTENSSRRYRKYLIITSHLLVKGDKNIN